MARVSSRSTSAACFSTLPGGARPHPPMATRARDAARAATHSRHPSPPTPRACPCRRPASPPNASTPSRQPSDRRAAPAPIAQCARHHQGRGHLGRPEGGLRQCGHRRVRRAVKGLPDRRVVAQGRGRRRQHLTAPQRVEWPTSRASPRPRPRPRPRLASRPRPRPRPPRPRLPRPTHAACMCTRARALTRAPRPSFPPRAHPPNPGIRTSARAWASWVTSCPRWARSPSPCSSATCSGCTPTSTSRRRVAALWCAARFSRRRPAPWAWRC